MGPPNATLESPGRPVRRKSMRLDVVQRSLQRKPSMRPVSLCQVHLPIDLLQHIMDELDEDSVRQCALAARCFVLPARRRLFTAISLCEEEYPKSLITRRWHKLRVGIQRHISSQLSIGSTRCRQFADLLEISPHLGEFTEELIIEGLELTTDYRSWYNIKDAPLHLILPRLPNLKSISFLFSQNFPLLFHWLPPLSCEAIVRAVQSSKIQRVVIENVIFEEVEDLIHFLKHAASGGNLTELSITSLSTGAAAKESNNEWKEMPIPPLNTTETTNVLESFQLVGCSIHAEKVFQWARGSDERPIQLGQLSTLEVVTPMSFELIKHVTDVIRTQSTTSRLQHLGLTYSAESLRSLQLSSDPLTKPFLWQAQNTLRSITFYPISRDYDDLFAFPEDMVDWWCSILKTFSFPNLTEFRIQRRGTHAHYMLSGVFGDAERFASNAAQWQRFEIDLEKSAPNATLRVELRSKGYFGVEKWKRIYFPEGDYSSLETFFPLAHLGRVPFVLDLEVNTVSTGLHREHLALRMASLRQALKLALLCASFTPFARSGPLVSSPGQKAAIPNWSIQSSAKVDRNIGQLSQLSYDTSSWHSISSHATLMAGLLESGVYKDTDLFFSENLKHVDTKQFAVPWFYRNTFTLQPNMEQFYHLHTHGISSRAEIYLNGQLIADNQTQAGAYAGQDYSITPFVKSGENVLLVRVHPTDYNRDLAIGFVDWNPYPPDNGTGIWRDVEISQTGPVAISPPRITTNFEKPGVQSVEVTVKVDVENFSNRSVNGVVSGAIHGPDGSVAVELKKEFGLQGQKKDTLELKCTIYGPRVWWPKQWGDQPLYSVQLSADVAGKRSDASEERKFGIRSVRKELNSYNDTTFFVNGQRFQVVGAGYTSDMFLRFSQSKLRSQFEYVLDMHHNTVRLEGKQEHPALYSLADELGLMIMPGWECCDKWEGWSYNDEGSGIRFTNSDYLIAQKSMLHEARMMQNHPSILAFLVGSDFWPDDRATPIYVDALKGLDWQAPIIASASKRGFPKLLGPGGMKMEGPYDWVPPNYWYTNDGRVGAAGGFGSELGAGAGTPEKSSLTKFLSKADMDDLWKQPKKGLYHMSKDDSTFFTRELYNKGLWARYGEPKSLEDYLIKAQMADYEATRAEFEAYAAYWNARRPATGLIYWMLNNAWPSLHWNFFDYYLKPAGSFYGAKVGSRIEHVAYDYSNHSVYLINKSLQAKGARTLSISLISTDGKVINEKKVEVDTDPNTSKKIANVEGWDKIQNVGLLKLVLTNGGETLSRNVYWVSKKLDVLDWDNSDWYFTPVTNYADLKALNSLATATVDVKAQSVGQGRTKVVLENKSTVPAVFVRLEVVDQRGDDVLPVFWSDNYVTLWPGEKVEMETRFEGGSRAQIKISGKNVDNQSVEI
ncbi:hypothetical protein V5O48_001606 [Marasmius crinis-equi]|uniref:Exo-1,4-beta-D-glucosaminidase n=1 Tax=Marasmius crinis-equi TaxID=585013 RepID=A0ABR3FZ96_9AGAR